jgi:exosortase K
MMHGEKMLKSLGNLLVYAVAMMVAFGLKYMYSRASGDDLTWILGPTAGLVRAMTGVAFFADGTAGYVNGDLGIAIAPACSGVNFLIIAYAMAFFSFAHHGRTLAARIQWMALSLGGAYLLTLGVNGVRISVSIVTISRGMEFGWLTAERIHRLQGIVIYFFFLCLYYQVLNHVVGYPEESKAWARRAVSFVRGPLVWYLSVVLLVPVLTGHYRDQDGRFAEHFLTVAVSCACVLLVMGVIRRFFHDHRDRKRQKHQTV